MIFNYVKEHYAEQKTQNRNSVPSFSFQQRQQQSSECLINSSEGCTAHLFQLTTRLLEWNSLENCRGEDNHEAVILFLHSSSHCSPKNASVYSGSALIPIHHSIEKYSAEPRIN